MSDNIKRLIVVGSFLVFNYILPAILYKVGVESDWLYVVFKLLSVIAIPIFMYNSFNMAKIVNYLAIAFLLIELVYLQTGLSVSYTVSDWVTSLVIILNYPMFFFFFFVAWTLKVEYLFDARSVIPLVVLAFVFVVRRFMEFLCIINDIGYDIGYYTKIGAGSDIMWLVNSRELVFFIYSLCMYVFLEMLLYEDRIISSE